MKYTGYKVLQLNDESLVKLYNGGIYDGEKFLENEYMIVQRDGAPIDYFQFKGDRFEQIKFPSLESEFAGVVKPRNAQQYCAMSLLKNDIPVKLITGCFGSGKTMLCVVAALEHLQKNHFEKIVFVRNNVQVNNTDALGALPGDVYDKTLPYLMPFADHTGGTEGIEMLIAQGKMEVIPLAFLRGRDIRNSIIYSMESENLTKEHIQLIMGRVGEGSQLWMDGDIHQRDKAIFEKSAGLETMVDRLKGNPLFGYVHLVKSERSEVARLCDLLD